MRDTFGNVADDDDDGLRFLIFILVEREEEEEEDWWGKDEEWEANIQIIMSESWEKEDQFHASFSSLIYPFFSFFSLLFKNSTCAHEFYANMGTAA